MLAVVIVMDKRILKEVAKRICKSILQNSKEVVLMDEKDVLTEEEINFISDEIQKIADKITDKPVYHNFTEMLSEYYDF